MSEVLGSEFSLRIDAWYDLVCHVLSHLPLDGPDASSLFDEGYVSWCDRRFAERTPGSDPVPRTLLTDAPLMASLYAASKRGALLHAWPLLHDGIDDFRRTAATGFEQLTWTSSHRERLADAIRANTHPALPDLFRTALWSELANGYEMFRKENVVLRSESYREAFVRQLSRLTEDLPGLVDPAWVLSHPLRTHGRLLRPPAAGPIIVVGVADDDLEVAESLPLMQGCHEYFVWKVGSAVPAGEGWSSAVGQPGYEAFRAVEDAALVLGARFFTGSRWEASHRAWLARIFPGSHPARNAARLAAGKMLPPDMAAAVADLET